MTNKQTNLKVFLDDERETPEGFFRTYTAEETIEVLKNNEVLLLSLDHDLGDDKNGTGYMVLLWIEEQVALHHYVPPVIQVHSSNSSAVVKMSLAIASIKRLAAINC